MGELINLQSRKNQKFKEENKRLQKDCEEIENLINLFNEKEYFHREDGKIFILQGVTPHFRDDWDKTIKDLNNCDYLVDNQLIIDGWNICGPIPLNENYFIKRKKLLSIVGFLEIREEKSKFKDTDEPCVVFYGRGTKEENRIVISEGNRRYKRTRRR